MRDWAAEFDRELERYRLQIAISDHCICMWIMAMEAVFGVRP